MKNILILLSAAAALTFSSCKKDPCEDVNCQNGGVCNEGTCDCPEGFSGAECGTAITPTSMTITQIDVIDFPGTDNGSDWDPFVDTDPDILIELVDDGTSSILYTSSTFSNQADGSQFSINGLDIAITGPTSTYTLTMVDYDATSGDDPMGNITFTPYNGSSFPSTISVKDDALQIDYRVHVSYAW